MDNILRAFEKRLASIVTTEQVKLAFEPCANVVRAPPCPSLCVHRLPLALARSVPRATCSRFHHRTAAADARAS
eukprot:855150-Prymnesium_polylepis.1